MGLFNFLFGSKKRKAVVKEFGKADYFPQTPIPTRTYNKSVQEDSKDDDWCRRRKNQYDDDFMNPLNPVSPIFYGNNNDTPIPESHHTDFGGGDFGGGGSSSNWTPPDTGSQSDSGSSSSSDSSSYDSGSSDSGSSSCDSSSSSSDF